MRASEVTRASTSLERERHRDLVHQSYLRLSLAAIAVLAWLVLERMWG